MRIVQPRLTAERLEECWEAVVDHWYEHLCPEAQLYVLRHGIMERIQFRVPVLVSDQLTGENHVERVELNHVAKTHYNVFDSANRFGKVTLTYLADVFRFCGCETPENWHLSFDPPALA